MTDEPSTRRLDQRRTYDRARSAAKAERLRAFRRTPLGKLHAARLQALRRLRLAASDARREALAGLIAAYTRGIDRITVLGDVNGKGRGRG